MLLSLLTLCSGFCKSIWTTARGAFCVVLQGTTYLLSNYDSLQGKNHLNRNKSNNLGRLNHC